MAFLQERFRLRGGWANDLQNRELLRQRLVQLKRIEIDANTEVVQRHDLFAYRKEGTGWRETLRLRVASVEADGRRDAIRRLVARAEVALLTRNGALGLLQRPP